MGDHARTVASGAFDATAGPDLVVAYETADPGGTRRSWVGFMANDGRGNLVAGWHDDVGSDNQLVVGLEVGDFAFDGSAADGFLDFRAYLALPPSPDATQVTRHDYQGDGQGTFTYRGGTPGAGVPDPIAPCPLGVDLNGDSLLDHVYVNRRAEDLSNLPIAGSMVPSGPGWSYHRPGRAYSVVSLPYREPARGGEYQLPCQQAPRNSIVTAGQRVSPVSLPAG